MIEYPSFYVEMLQNTGRDDEVDSWELLRCGENEKFAVYFWENMTNYTEKIFKPYLARINNKLHEGKTSNSGLIRNQLDRLGKTKFKIKEQKYNYEG